MEIIIRHADNRPIYEQICAQIKRAILTGELAHASPLPSIRLMARELRVSVITVRRAYDDLEREGFIETAPGKGCFVNAKNRRVIREEYLRRAEHHLAQALAEAEQGGLSLTELQEMLQLLSKGG